MVVSTGGGAVIRRANREFISRQGIVILLTASPETLIRRIKNTKGRPLLEEGDLEEKIKNLQAAREPYYRQCHLKIDTSGLGPEETAAKIIRLLELQ